MDDTVISQFSVALSGPDAVITDPDMLAKEGRDYWVFGGTPGLVPHTR